MLKIAKNKKGFTLVEIVIVMAISAIVITVAISPNFIGARNKNSLTLAVLRVKTDIMATMERTRAQEGGFQWWMHFDNPAGAGNDFYSICYGTYSGTPGASCANEDGTQASREYLGQDVELTDPASGANKDIVFVKPSGLPTAQTQLTIASSGGAFTSTITVTVTGRIDSTI